MQILYSCENTAFMWWQAELLHYTCTRQMPSAELTALVASTTEPIRRFSSNVVRVRNYKEEIPGQTLLTLNKPGAFSEWAGLEGSAEETVFIVDTDSVFLRPLKDPGSIPEWVAYSEDHDYMGLDLPQSKEVLDRHCAPGIRPRVQPVGIYILISRGSLAELAPRWLAKSIDIGSDPVCRKALGDGGWLSDMWGYILAAAEIGLHHQIVRFSQGLGSNRLDFPIIHYCSPLMAEPGTYWIPGAREPILWSKWDYKPWEVPPDPSAALYEGRALLEQLSALAELKRQERAGRRPFTK